MFASLSEKHEHKKVLPDLEGCRERGRDAVCPEPLRPAPYRACPCRGLNDAYVKQYGGRYILRIEDTDPKRVDPEAYEMVGRISDGSGLGSRRP
jgi:glutamyl-tRNA synthetase